MANETTTSVAHFVSMATENEIRDPGRLDFADVTEVGAELQNREGDETSLGRPYSQFVVKTSDGKTWNVRVTPQD